MPGWIWMGMNPLFRHTFQSVFNSPIITQAFADKWYTTLYLITEPVTHFLFSTLLSLHRKLIARYAGPNHSPFYFPFLFLSSPPLDLLLEYAAVEVSSLLLSLPGPAYELTDDIFTCGQAGLYVGLVSSSFSKVSSIWKDCFPFYYSVRQQVVH